VRTELLKANRSANNSNSFDNLSFKLFVLRLVETSKILAKEAKALFKEGTEILLCSFSKRCESSHSVLLDD
jgi:hypothetical protein